MSGYWHHGHWEWDWDEAAERRLEELDVQARNDAHAREWDPEDWFPDDMFDNVTITDKARQSPAKSASTFRACRSPM